MTGIARDMLERAADFRYIQQLLAYEKLETTAICTEVNIRQLQEVHARCQSESLLRLRHGLQQALHRGQA